MCFCRLEDLYAIDIRFLHGCEIPTIAYLVEVWLGPPHELERVLVTNVTVRDDVMVQLIPYMDSLLHKLQKWGKTLLLATKIILPGDFMFACSIFYYVSIPL